MSIVRRRLSPEASRDAALQHGHRDAVVRREADVGQRRGGALCEQQLVRRAALHRRRRIDQDVDVDVLFFDEQLDEQLLEPRIEVPVERTQVIAEGVVAVVGELDRLAPLDERRTPFIPPRTACFVTSMRRSSWRRNASSNTVGSTAP